MQGSRAPRLQHRKKWGSRAPWLHFRALQLLYVYLTGIISFVWAPSRKRLWAPGSKGNNFEAPGLQGRKKIGRLHRAPLHCRVPFGQNQHFFMGSKSKKALGSRLQGKISRLQGSTDPTSVESLTCSYFKIFFPCTPTEALYKIKHYCIQVN